MWNDVERSAIHIDSNNADIEELDGFTSEMDIDTVPHVEPA